MSISFSTTYSVYYTFQSVHSGDIRADTRKSLHKKMIDFRDEQIENHPRDIELITFEAIKRTETKVLDGEFGSYCQFRKITNPYMHGRKKPSSKFYRKFKD